MSSGKERWKESSTRDKTDTSPEVPEEVNPMVCWQKGVTLSPHLLSNVSSISTSKFVLLATQSYPLILTLPLAGPLSEWIQLIKTAASYLSIYIIVLLQRFSFPSWELTYKGIKLSDKV